MQKFDQTTKFALKKICFPKFPTMMTRGEKMLNCPLVYYLHFDNPETFIRKQNEYRSQNYSQILTPRRSPTRFFMSADSSGNLRQGRAHTE